MPKIVYEVVEHDGGWAYRVAGAYSESFPSHSDAMQAAQIAATAQQRQMLCDLEMSREHGEALAEPLNFEILDRRREVKRFSLANSL